MASLSCLPTEIQCLIFRLLDPAGLIAASQTNQHFRKVIQPARKHFIERLIQLECDEKEGGNIPHFNPINNALSPGWSEPEWKGMRWACSGCLRLLSEQHFDNHSILRLEYRKPIPDYSTSDCFTTWEPGPRNSPYLSHIRREQRLQSDHFAEKKLTRRRYALALSNRWSDNTWSPRAQEICHELQSCGWTAFENMTSTEFLKLTTQEKKKIFEEEIRAIEAIRCGSKRHLRKCHECRYQSGQLKPTLKGSDGKAKIPFTAGRQYRIPTGIDRYYPRFWEKLRNQRPANSPPSYAVYRVHVRDRFWAMYMIRCPHCEKWKEERMFPVDYVQPRGDRYSRRTPKFLSQRQVDELRCLKCYAEKNGPGPLGMILMNDLQKMLLTAARGLMFSMGHGFHILLYEPELNEWSKPIQNEIRALASEPNKVAKNISKGTGLNDLPKPDEFAFICERYSAWMEVRERILNSKEADLLQQREAEGTNWLYLWSHMFKDMEAFYNWLLAVHQEVGKKPEKLAEWALRGSIAEMPPVFTEPYIRLPW